MTQAITAQEARLNAWPIDTPERILTAMAGRDGVTAEVLSTKSGLPQPIVVEWLTDKVAQRLLRFDAETGAYCSLCRWPAAPKAVNGTNR